jgi:hypothetical protein
MEGEHISQRKHGEMRFESKADINPSRKNEGIFYCVDPFRHCGWTPNCDSLDASVRFWKWAVPSCILLHLTLITALTDITKVYTTDPTLPNHTIYRASNPSAVNISAPILVWGNGGCSANGISQKNFLLEIASWGFLVIASGGPNASGSTTAKMMTESVDWAVWESRILSSRLYFN